MSFSKLLTVIVVTSNSAQNPQSNNNNIDKVIFALFVII